MRMKQLLNVGVLSIFWMLDGRFTFAQVNQQIGVPWPATDGLGRKLPRSEEVGLPRPERFVGVFYFLWHNQHSDSGPFDISKILERDPAAITNAANPLWGPMRA